MRLIGFFRDHSGLTLIELLMAVVILGIVFTLSGTMIVQSFSFFAQSTERDHLVQRVEMALEEVKGYLRGASVGSLEGCGTDAISFTGFIYRYQAEDDTMKEYLIAKEGEELVLRRVYSPDTSEKLRVIARSVEFFAVNSDDNSRRLLTISLDLSENGRQARREARVRPRNP